MSVKVRKRSNSNISFLSSLSEAIQDARKGNESNLTNSIQSPVCCWLAAVIETCNMRTIRPTPSTLS